MNRKEYVKGSKNLSVECLTEIFDKTKSPEVTFW